MKRIKAAEGGNPPNGYHFLHESWIRSRDFRIIQDLRNKAAQQGLPRPPIPAAVKAKYMVSWADLCAPVPETHNKLEPKLNKQGEPVRDHKGEVVFVAAKPVISRDGVDQGIKDMFVNNCYVRA